MPLVGERRSILILVVVLCFTAVSIPQIKVVKAEPVAEFTYTPLSPLPMEPILFDASGSYDVNGGNIMSYWWDFGDGELHGTINPITTHTYNSSGTYNVSLKVSNNLGLNSSIFFRTILISEIPATISIETHCNTNSRTMSLSELEITATGRLFVGDGNGIKDAPVALLYKNENTSQYKFVASCFTGQTGWYSLGWIPPATGNFILKIEWTPWVGNPTYNGASATAWVSTLTVQDQYSFLVGSNSSISNLFFNATDRKLSFNVESNIGTKGYARIVTTKSLLNNWGLNAKLYMDGNELCLTENEIQYLPPSIEDWAMGDFVQFEVNYDYGSHQIVLDHDITIVPEFPSEIILLIFTIVTLVVMVVKKKLK